jgi:hypothetical protein
MREEYNKIHTATMKPPRRTYATLADELCWWESSSRCNQIVEENGTNAKELPRHGWMKVSGIEVVGWSSEMGA